jgi:peptide/nickel transport system substrate-binding protein
MKTARAVQRLKAAFVGAAILGLAVYPAGNANGSTKSTLVLVQSIAPTSMNPNIDKIRANVRVQNQVIETGSEYQYIKGAYALVPTLVTGWKQSGLNGWIFKVRPGVQFSNGEKLTSAAFKFTLDAYRAYTGGKLAAFFKDWTIQVIDPLSFKVITTLPNDTSVPGLMTQFFVYPPKYFAEVGAVAYGEKPIGTGPYKLKQLKAGSEVDLVANAKYWGQKATIKNVTVRAVPDDATRVSALLAGQADIAEGVAQPLISRVSASKNYGIRSVQTGNVFFLMINMNLPPFDNVLVRQALNYSIDRSSLATYLFKQTA